MIREHIENEIRKCKEDPIYFLETYGYIKPGKKRFILFDYQKNYIKTVLSNKYVIVNKPRQCGISTVTAGICLWYAVFHPNKEIAIVSINDKEAMYFLNERVRFLYENMPPWLVGKLTKSTEHLLKFDNGSWIEALATTKRALRGRTPSIAVIDEIAHNQFADEMMTSAMPSLIHGEHLILISTPNGTEGIGSYFYKMWIKAEAKENNFVPFSINWWEVPLYNPKAPQYADWRENEWAMQQYKNSESEAKFRQEILREWILSGETVLSQKVLDKLSPRTPIRTDFIKNININPEEAYSLSESGWDERFLYAKGLWIWKEPVPNHYYTIGVDISTGRADDYSAIEVIDIVTMEQVAEYRFRIPTSYLPEIVYKLALYYNNAYVGIETNSDEGVINKLIEKGYDNIYYRMKRKTPIPGWHTDTRTRGILISHLQDTFISERIKIYSSRLINELKTFVWRNGKAQAAKKATDDLVFAFMIADYIIESCILFLGLDLDISSRTGKKQEEISAAEPLPPVVTTSSLDIETGGLKTEQHTRTKENKKQEEVVEFNIEEFDVDIYEINKEFYPFVGMPKS